MQLLTEAQQEAAVALAAAEAWRRGTLNWKLDSNQVGIRLEMEAKPRGRFILECARRLGKTYLLCVLAVEVCIRKAGARVVYAGPTIKDVTEFIIPNFDAVCADAPPELKPFYDATKGHLRFPNGSYVHIFGCDDKRKANRGRGPAADLLIVDEAGFIPILSYVVKSVLRPQSMTTGARMFIASTPAEEPGHDFTAMAERAEANGTYARRTIYDNPRLSEERIREYIDEDAADEGMTHEEYVETDTFRREYLAERVTDATLVGVPEWPKVAAQLTVERERPEYFDGYTALDYGGADPHAALFAYLDFERGVLVVEDELLLREGENTADLADAIKTKERALWGTSGWDGTLRLLRESEGANLPDEWSPAQGVRPQPYARIADHDVQLTRDLRELHGIAFVPAIKTDKQHAVNRLNVLLRQLKIEIHPRCRNLIRHLLATLWKNHNRDDWKRKNGEHGDLVDALLYLSRAVDWTRNPWPRTYSREQPATSARRLAAALGGRR